MQIREILTEGRNVINVAEIETLIREMLDRAIWSSEEPWRTIHDWLFRVFRQHALTSFDDAYQIETLNDTPDGQARLRHRQSDRTLYFGVRNLPAWVKPRFKAGDEILWIEDEDFENWLKATFPPVLDWFRHLAHTHDPMLTPQRLSRMTLQQAETAAEQWHEALKRRADVVRTFAPIEGEKPVMELSGGYRWVSLTTAEALDREGERMGHCVGSYADDVAAGTEIYSLRDGQNAPHVTIEAEAGGLDQIKGKGNEPPVEKYWPMVDAFITAYSQKHKITVGRFADDDFIGCGLVVYRSPRQNGGVTIIRPSTPLKDLTVTYREINYDFDEDGSGDYEEVEVDSHTDTLEQVLYYNNEYLDHYQEKIALALLFQGYWRRSVTAGETEYEYENGLEVTVSLKGMPDGVPHRILCGPDLRHQDVIDVL